MSQHLLTENEHSTLKSNFSLAVALSVHVSEILHPYPIFHTAHKDPYQPLSLPTMAEEDVCSPFRPIPQGQASALELLFPGLSRICPVIQQYTGIDLDALIPLLCLCGLLVFVWKHGYRYFCDCVYTYLSQSPLRRHSR